METQVDPEVEVRKLQCLVKKLERQNEFLRNKAGGIGSNKSSSTPQKSRSRNNMAISSSQQQEEMTKLNDKSDRVRLANGAGGEADYSLLDDSVELLDSEINDMMKEEEDSWLYVSPLRALTPEERAINVYDWIRQDLDHPSEEMESAKRSLQAKLDELSRAQRNSLGPSALVIQPPIMVDASVGVGRLDSSPSLSPSPQPGPTCHFPYQSSTVPRRERERERERRISGDRKSGEELVGYSKLEDVTDVQILAKMQEESLRQAMHNQSPSNSPRRSTSAGVSPASSESTLHKPASRTNSHGSNADREERAQLEASDAKTSNVVRRRPSLERIKKVEGDTRRYSYGAKAAPPNHTADNGESITIPELQKLALERQATHKGSLPNLNRTYPKEVSNSNGSSPTSNAVPQLTHSPINPAGTIPNNYADHPSEARLKHPTSPSPTRSIPGRSSVLKQPSPSKLRNASPQRSGIPVRSSAAAERSGIPRPRSAVLSPQGRLLLPASRSSLTIPRTSSKTKEDSWREGCY